jgi:hypothetical protein
MPMKTNEAAPPEKSGLAEALRISGKAAFVHCAGFSCMAYRDRNGTWRSLYGNRPLPEIVEIEQ